MTEEERELDLLVAELGSELRKMREENAALKEAIATATAERDRIKRSMERIHAISLVAFRDGRPERVSQVGQKERTQECND